jgi:Pro-kumamolisin, activation domain/Viral BACON domain
VPAAISELHLGPLRDLPLTNHLNLAIGLPLRHQSELHQLLQQIYDPSSANYHHYLTPQEFTGRFGPTQKDYDAVIQFAQANGLEVTTTYSNRALVDVSGDAGTVEKTFHVKLHEYRHPVENRNFYAPDGEPSVDLAVPLLHIDGLNNFVIPHPALVRKQNLAGVRPASGSGPGGLLMGSDFRNAYIPGVTLNGAGQTVALFELDGYYSNDITSYCGQAGLPVPVLTNVFVDSYSGAAGPNNVEVALDIEMLASMATNLSQVIVYEANINGGNSVVDVLNRIASDDLAAQISCSWTFGEDSASFDTAYEQMDAQGQSFFEASGDYGAYYYEIPAWADDTNITLVGGTTLSMNGSGDSYSSEVVWNWNTSGEGSAASGGGVSFNGVPIPIWQTNIDMTANGGSTTLRNVPDVAMNADNIFIVADNGQQEFVGGTSGATPLWAAFTALANQRAAIFGDPSMGFLNPTIYSIGQGPGYATNFNDITVGNNTTPYVSDEYFAVTGYDLCTGWGSPIGSNLLNTLVPPDSLIIAPLAAFNMSGPGQGPFSPSSQTFFVTNSSAAPLEWSLINTSSWLNASIAGGTLDADDSTNVSISIDAAANDLAVGTYQASVQFSNWDSQVVQTFSFTLQVKEPLSVAPLGAVSSSGLFGGPFNVTTESFTLCNISSAPLGWQSGTASTWLNVWPTSGALAAGGQTNVIVSLNSTASNLVAGIYAATIFFTNQTFDTVQTSLFNLLIGQSLIQNGGFETGDFTDWTLEGDGGNYDFVDDGSYTGIPPHSGNYFAALGEVGFQAYLLQTVPTMAGQSYLLTLWLNCPDPDPPTEFSVAWNGNTLFDQVDMPQTTMPPAGWTNLQFIVTATNETSLLQIGGQDDYDYLGLDDVSLLPIPTAALQPSMTTTTNGLAFSWNTLTGMVYEVQFKTNLFQPNWTVLQDITASNTPACFVDTNCISGSPQGFYRLLLLP